MLNDPGLTRSLGAPGTAIYMSPERLHKAEADCRSDIWAIGVIMAEMLTGRHPFLRENFDATLYAIENEAPATLDGVPQELQSIVYRALAKNPSRRYQTCAELLADSERVRSQLRSVETAPDAIPPPIPAVSSKDFKRYVHAASESTDKQLKRRRWVLGGLAALGVVAALWLSPARSWINNLMRPQPKHIAVLPFDNVGSAPINAAVADGLMDSLTNKLSNLAPGKESLWVVPASVVRERRVDKPASAWRDLGATYVVKGAIARDGQSVRLSLILIATNTLRQVGSFEVEDPAGDIRRLQDDSVKWLAHMLNVSENPTSGGGDSSVPAAYEAYLQALSYLRRYDKPGNLDLAISQLHGAVQRDPQFALGYAQLGEAYRLKYQQEHNRQWIEEALAYCKKALALNDRLSAVYVTLGRIHNDSGNHSLAVDEFRHALELDPRDADALNGMAYGQETAGQVADAEATYKKVIALRPDYWDAYNTLGAFYVRQRRFDDAIEQLQRARQLTPDNTQVYNNLAGVYLASGRPQDLALAENVLKKSIELEPTYPAFANLGYLYLQQKRYAEAAEMTRKALQLNANDYLVWENLDWAYRWLGEDDKAAPARQRARAILALAVQSNPRDAQAQAHLALQYASQGQHANATAAVQAALALTQDDPEVFAYVSDTCEKLGDHGLAMHYAQLSLAKGYSLNDLRRDPDMQSVLADANFRAK